MALIVPFDGSTLAQAALARAREFGTAFEEPVVAVAVIPMDNDEYARERGWLEDGQPFALETVAATLRDRVAPIAPAAEFRHEVVDRYAARGTIASRIRTVAREVDAGMVFLGSENAGRLVTSITSVASSVAADQSYDVVIVRHRVPAAGTGTTDRPA